MVPSPILDAVNPLTVLDHRRSDGSGLCYFGYDYDAASKITSVRREEGMSVYYGYDDADRLTAERWYNGAGQSIYG